MPVTNSQDEWNRRRIDSTHINPSIMEGERGHTSLFGKGSAVTIIRYAPTFLVQPSITGSFKIPSVLTCNPGVIDSSPQANLFFQWKADGVDIPGQTNKTITTYLELDAVELTCEVTAVNFLGVVMGLSNGITAELIEPIINQQYMHYAVTGLNQELQQNLFKSDVLITSGISMSDRSDVQQHVILIPTGMWVALRDDVMTSTVSAITGVGPDNGGHNYNLGAYTVWQPTPLPDPVITNHTGELGSTSGWIITQGNVLSVTSANGASVPLPNNETHFFKGVAQVDLSESIMYQDIPISVGEETAVDAGTTLFDSRYWVDSEYGFDKLKVQIQCLDDLNVVLSTHIRDEAYNKTAQGLNWQGYGFDMTYIPAGTRKFRVTVTFVMSQTAFITDNNGYFCGLIVRMFNDT